MKTCCLLFLTLAGMGATFAQNWSPLVPGDRYNFRHSDSSLITHVLAIDSVETASGGIVHYALNRVVGDCDTCSPQARLARQGQFLQKWMTEESPGGRVSFTGKHRYSLFPNAQTGESWLLDTLQNRTAHVDAIVAGTVLGEPDSLKIIAISDGTQIRLSKMHGLFAFPDWDAGGQYELVGIPTRNLGAQAPGWLDFFNFESGDIFEYQSENTLDPGTPNTSNWIQKLVVLDKFWDGDTLTYTLDERKRSWLHYAGIPYPLLIQQIHDTISWRFHPALNEPWLDAYPGQYAEDFWPVFGGGGSRVSLREHPVYGISKLLGAYSPSLVSVCGLFGMDTIPGQDVLPCDLCASFHKAYSVGLGFTSYEYSCFEVIDITQLTGFVKNGDTTGILTPDSLITVANRPEPQIPTVQVEPNPASEAWGLVFPEPLPEPVAFQLRDQNGRLVLNGIFESGVREAQIPAGALPSGLYLLQGFGKKNAWSVRLLKQG